MGNWECENTYQRHMDISLLGLDLKTGKTLVRDNDDKSKKSLLQKL